MEAVAKVDGGEEEKGMSEKRMESVVKVDGGEEEKNMPGQRMEEPIIPTWRLVMLSVR